MAITASRLRARVYRVETGTPVEIEHRGQRLRIVRDEPRSRVARLVRRPHYLRVDPTSIVHLDWRQ